MNHIRTSIITRVRNKFGVAQQAALLSWGFPPKSFLCSHSDWPDTSQGWSLKTWQKLGNIFATCCTTSSQSLPQSPDSFQESKVTVHRVSSCGPRTAQPWVLISGLLRSVQIQQQGCSSLYQDCGHVDLEPGLCAIWEASPATLGWSKPSSAKLPPCLFHPSGRGTCTQCIHPARCGKEDTNLPKLIYIAVCSSGFPTA